MLIIAHHCSSIDIKDIGGNLSGFIYRNAKLAAEDCKNVDLLVVADSSVKAKKCNGNVTAKFIAGSSGIFEGKFKDVTLEAISKSKASLLGEKETADVNSISHSEVILGGPSKRQELNATAESFVKSSEEAAEGNNHIIIKDGGKVSIRDWSSKRASGSGTLTQVYQNGRLTSSYQDTFPSSYICF